MPDTSDSDSDSLFSSEATDVLFDVLFDHTHYLRVEGGDYIQVRGGISIFEHGADRTVPDGTSIRATALQGGLITSPQVPMAQRKHRAPRLCLMAPRVWWSLAGRLVK